jgi:hypothetical protein
MVLPEAFACGVRLVYVVQVVDELREIEMFCG